VANLFYFRSKKVGRKVYVAGINMKLNFKIKILPLLLAVLSQTACFDRETRRVKSEQNCQVSRSKTYNFEFYGFLNTKKLVLREMANGNIVQERKITIDSDGLPDNVFVADIPLMDAKNKNYYQIIIDDHYLFTLTEIDIYAVAVGVCLVREFKLNGKRRFITDSDGYLTLDKKDAIILPVTTP